jgi:uncharacterized protein YjiS (DUF1127 family)
MQTDQTNLTSATGRDDAGLDLSVPSVKGATDGALPEKNAAGPPAATARSALRLLRRYWLMFQERRRRQSLRATLQDLTDRELMDIGLTRGEIDYVTRHRAIERLRDGTTYLWILSRGVM